MKKIYSLIPIIISFLLLSCTESGEAVVGSNQSTEITGLTFNIDTTYLETSQQRLVAKGKVINSTNVNVTSPWYVEGQFYSDATYSTKLGGNYTQIGVPLSKGQSTFWTLYFSSSNVDVTDYPNFRIGDLRGIYK